MPSFLFFAGLFFVMPLTGCTLAAEPTCTLPEQQPACVKRSAKARAQTLIAPPTLSRPQRPASSPPAIPPVVVPAPPDTVGPCDPGGCWNAGGGRYQGGTGNTYLDSKGRPCQRNGAFMQCF